MLCVTGFFTINSIWDILTLISFLIAILAFILYFIKPKIIIDPISVDKNWIRAKVTNKSSYTVVEAQCEIVLSNDDFNTVATIRLIKDKTLAIKPNGNYVFKGDAERQIDLLHPFDEYSKIRVRVTVANLIGVRQVYEVIQTIK